MQQTVMFKRLLDEFSEEVRQNAENHGCSNMTDERYIVLMHTELSEAIEALRIGNPKSEKIPEFSLVEEELADVLIRVLDYAKVRGYNVGGAMIAKARYNLGRPHKHGKVW